MLLRRMTLTSSLTFFFWCDEKELCRYPPSICSHSLTATTQAPALPTHRGATCKVKNKKNTSTLDAATDWCCRVTSGHLYLTIWLRNKHPNHLRPFELRLTNMFLCLRHAWKSQLNKTLMTEITKRSKHWTLRLCWWKLKINDDWQIWVNKKRNMSYASWFVCIIMKTGYIYGSSCILFHLRLSFLHHSPSAYPPCWFPVWWISQK